MPYYKSTSNQKCCVFTVVEYNYESTEFVRVSDTDGQIAGSHSVLTEEEMSKLQKISEGYQQDPIETFKHYVCNHTWCNKEEYAAALEIPLLRLCTRYLYLEKRRGFALNPVGMCVFVFSFLSAFGIFQSFTIQ